LTTDESDYGAMVDGCWQGKTEILGEKPVPVPLSPKLPEGSKDNHKNFSQYICMYSPPHINVGICRDMGEKNMPDPYSISQWGKLHYDFI
jgi:hypothetical protein